MPIIRNLKKDFEEGRMDKLRSVSYKDTGTEAPYVAKSIGSSHNQITKRIDDVARMGKMLIDKPGLKHLSNEALLKQGELTRKLEGNNGSIAGNIIRRVGGTVKHVAQVAASTIAQVPVNGTGTHFLRAFRTDTYLQDGDPVSGFASFFGAGGVEGTKYALRGERVPSQGLLSNSDLPDKNTTANPGDLGGENHIGINYRLSGLADRVTTYSNNKPFYQSTEGVITGIRNKGIIFPNFESGLKVVDNTTVVPYTLGVNKSKTGASLAADFVAESNPMTQVNKYSPTNSTEFLGSKSEKNNLLAQRGYPINPGSSVGDVTINGVTTEDLFIPTSFTTAVSGSFGVTNKDVDFNISNLDQKFATVFEIGDTKSKLTTPENITAASSKTKVIPLKEGNETTATKEQFGITNTGIEGDIASLINPDITKFELGDKKTKLDTQGNILAAQPLTTGSTINIPLTESPEPDDFIADQMSKELYNSDNTYTNESAEDHINNLKHGTLSNKTIANRVNVGLDPIGVNSKPIPDKSDTESATYNQLSSSTKVVDYRQIKDFLGINRTYSFNYSDATINKEQRVGLGNPGKKSRLRISYSVDDPDTVDKINKLDVSEKPLDGIEENRDLIQLEFQVITPEETYYLAFRAFLDKFDDSFNASWNSSKYLGRADSFYTYNGFERSINIGFKIAAQSREEMKPLYRKAATLASVTAPSYGTGGRFMRGTIAKVTVGDYIYEQPGIIESVQYSWQKDYPWEISFQNPEKEGGKDQILPHVLDVSISFKVIHDFLPEVGVTPFITNHRPIKGNKDIYIPLEDKKFIIPETAAEKREKAAKEEAAKKEEAEKVKQEAEKAKVVEDNKEFRDKGLIGPLLEDTSTTETAAQPFAPFM